MIEIEDVGKLDGIILSELLIITIVVVAFSFFHIKNRRLQFVSVLLTISVFFYSGYGIAYNSVDNRFLLHYSIYIICLNLPIILLSRLNVNHNHFSGYDYFLMSNRSFLRWCVLFYILTLFIPLIYPQFKLFDIFKNIGGVTEGIFEKRMMYKSNALINIVDALRMFLAPLFFSFLTIYQLNKPKSKIPLSIFLLTVLFQYMRYLYMSRYQMVIYIVFILIMTFSINGFTVKINKKHIILIGVILISFLPLLYMFMFFRIGGTSETNVSFGEMVSFLLDSETYYPIYYDDILLKLEKFDASALRFFLWILFLPIPSFIFPDKPKISYDTFTYVITGRRYGEEYYSSILPSALGESFLYFNTDFFWVHAIVIGIVSASVFMYMEKHKTLLHYSLYYILFSLVFGRGGSASYVPPVINGIVSVLIIQFFASSNQSKTDRIIIKQ